MTPSHLAILAGYFLLALALLNFSRSGIVRSLTIAFFLAAIGATAYAAVDGMGKPKPEYLAYDTARGCYAVRGYDFAENKAVYVWLAIGDQADPLLLALPWDIRTAQSLLDAQAKAAQNGTPLMMGLKGADCREGGQQGAEAGTDAQGDPTEAPPSSEGDSAGYDVDVFYAPPPAELPPKS